MYRVFIKGYKSPRKLYSQDEYQEQVSLLLNENPDSDFYESIFLYTEEQNQKITESGSASGIQDVVTDRIVFDFDSKEDIQLALNDARALSKELAEYVSNTSDIRCFFSGSKGFHIEIHSNGLITLEQFKNIVLPIGSKYKTFDTKIKDCARIFRFPITKHNITKNYKIPLTFDELQTIDLQHIIDASGNSEYLESFYETLNAFTISSLDLKSLVKETVIPIKSKIEQHVSEGYPDLSNKPTYMTTARYVLQQGFFGEGERNSACLILCSTYKNLGYSKDHAYNMLKATLRMRATRLGHEGYDKVSLWKEVIEPIYSPNWRGGQFKDKEDPLIMAIIDRYNLVYETSERETLDIREVSDRFIKFANEYKQNRIFLGIEEIDKNLLVTTGMMVGLLGAPSSGKTSTILNVLEHQSKNNISSLFISADMSHNLLYARLMQRYCSMSFQNILESIENKHVSLWSKELKDSWELVLENFQNVGFSFQSGPAVPDIARRIKEREDVTGQAVKVLVVDYLEKVRSETSDPTQASGKNASALADLSRDKELATFLLLQPQKSAGDPSDELVSMRKVKGASVIEQDCRVILTTWRPGFNPNVQGKNTDDIFSSFAIVKNNMGETKRMDLRFDGLTGRLGTLTPQERQFLKEVEEKARNRKAQAYRESAGGILEAPDKTDRVYTKPEGSHSFQHRALPNDAIGPVKSLAYKKKSGDMF